MNEAPQTSDSKIAERALQVMRALCKGNGVKMESVRLGPSNIQMLSFDAITRLEVRPHVEQKKSVKNLGNVEQLGSAEDVQSTIDSMLRNFAHDESAKNVVIKTVLSRKDKGFFMQRQEIPVDALQRTFGYTETCHNCRGEGRSTCQRCHGRTREPCNKCHARGTIPCIQCHGSGEMQGPNGQRVQCNRCFGKRVMPCDLCRQTGEIACRSCRSTGQTTCPVCKGAGGETHFTVVKMIATTNFDYQRDSVPPEVVELLEDKGPKLVPAGHIKLNAAKADPRQEAMAIDYYVEYPYGDINFTIRDRSINARLFGFKGKLLGLPNFLDQLITPGIKHLENAAAGHGSVTQHIRKAARYRIIGYGLIISTRLSVRKSTANMKQKFPVGLSGEMINRIVPLSKQAIGHISRKPLYIGTAIGLLFAAAFFGAYFIGPLRAELTPLIPNENLRPLVDFAVLGLGGFLASLIAQQVAGRAVKQALGHLVPPKKRGQLIPKSGGSSWWSYAGTFVLFFIVVEMTLHSGVDIPSWYASFRSPPTGF